MRILHLSMLYPPHVLGGAERSVAMLAETQARLGHDVAAACTTPGPFTTETRHGVRVYRMPHETLFWAEEWPKHRRLARLWRKAMQPFNRALERHFGHVLDEFRPDIVHTHSMVDVTTRCWLAAARRGIPIVHTLRDYDLLCADGSMYHGGRGCGVRCRILTAPKFAHHRVVAGVAAVGAETLRIHLDRGYFGGVPAARRAVILNSAALAPADPPAVRDPDAPFTFGYLGRLSPEKGVDTLIAAARLLPEQASWRLLVGGAPSDDLAPYRAAAGGLPIEFLGFVDPARFLGQVDVLVVPSRWAEPMGRVVVEAYSLGVPVIGARSGGIPDLIGADQDAWLFDPGDVAALAERMAAALARGRAALPGAADFAPLIEATRPEAIAARYDALYAAVLA